MNYTLEICAQDLASCHAATRSGAQRIELCSALELGGISPSMGLVEAAIDLDGPEVYVLVRPRSGYFTYNAAEFDMILEDAEQYLNAGADGIVFGSLDRVGKIERSQLAEMIDLVGNNGFTFHRAFDLVNDQLSALDILMEMNVPRVLTSGGERKAEEALPRLTELVGHGGDRISIMPGTGIHSGNLRDIMACGASEFHLSAQRAHPYEVEYTGKELFTTTFRSSNEAEIRTCMEILRNA